MSLLEYQRKRRFGTTREPGPDARGPEGGRAIFVVQLHHASRRHYDFRLQVGDALKSWAVPKGPSYDPAVKRMAVEVEDHPLDYASFEGEIPRGEYGGGHVALFDTGAWATDGDAEAQLAKGHLRFELFGRKLKGAWHLVRSGKGGKQPQWLLFKDKDDYAGTLEADDLLADVTPAPEADLARAGRGKAHKRRLAAVPVAKARRKDWAARALKLAGARKGTLANAAFAPQLAKLGAAPPQGAQWLHEIKWDGYRLVATIVDGTVRIWSRNAIEWTGKLPEIRAALEGLGLRSAALDGELIAGQGTQADFNLLQATLSGERQGALSYALFDLLHIDGVDIDRCALVERKALLEAVLADPPPHLAYSSHVAGEGEAAFRLASEQRFEGIISKRGDRPYHPGRGDDWRKTKALESDEFAVVGYTPGKGARTGFGSLLLARPDATHGWVYVGRVGSGFSDAQIQALSARIGTGGSARPTVHVGAQEAALRHATWFPPRFVVEVFIRGISHQGLLRQPSLKAVRPDKDVADLADSDRNGTSRAATGTQAATKKATKKAMKKSASPAAKAATGSTPGTAKKVATPKQATKAATGSKAAQKATTTATTAKAAASVAASKATTSPRTAARATAPSATRTGRAERASPSRNNAPRLTSPTRIVYPDLGLTKLDVANYYRAVMDHLLPEIAGRPLSIIRCPQGAEKPCFFQKHHTAGMDLVRFVKLKEESGRAANYLVVDSPEALMELVQFNALEFHPWGAHADTPDLADRVVFDLDPGPGVPFAEVKRAAVHVRDLLQQVGLVSFLRTSGGKGLHVVVPLDPPNDWAVVRQFAKGVADALAGSEPERFLAVATLKLRPGKIFVDYLRNARGATSVASYSLRARPGAPVAMPLAWSQLSRLKRPDAFDLRGTPALLKRRKADPWTGIDTVRQTLTDLRL